jgi:hypothetical protein
MHFWFVDVYKNTWSVCYGCQLVVNFLFSNWEIKHVTISLFEAITTNNVTMAPKLQELINMFSLTNKIFAYVKDEEVNL